MIKADVQLALKKECEPLNLDPFLLEAIISVESSWIPWAAGYEPATDEYVMTACTADIERNHRVGTSALVIPL